MTYRTGDIAAAAMVDASDRVLVAKSGCNERHQGELVKIIGLAVNDDARAAAFAAGVYTEVWNPPEARATAPHRVSAAHKVAVHRHAVSRAVKVHTRRMPTSAPGLVAKQNNMQKTVRADEPDIAEIPRQITPEGNVLHIDSRGISAEVTR